MTTVTWTPGAQQAVALDAIEDWYRNSPEQIFGLFGFAGTGKTTCSCHAVDRLGLTSVSAGAYTGKAAHVMRTRGGWPQASTLHSLIYQPVGGEDAEIQRLKAELILAKSAVDKATSQDAREALEEDKAELERQLAIELSKPKKLRFTLKEDSELLDAQLLVVDEVSMVDTEMAQHLLSFGMKTLVLGDPMQLPPVGGAGFFTLREPDALLTEVHRTALDSPITRIATAIRAADPADKLLGVHGSDDGNGRYGRPGDITRYDQVICGTNRTRWRLINMIRDALGLYGPKPLRGDRIIILANSKDLAVFNGQQFMVVDSKTDPEDAKGEKYLLQVVDDEGNQRELRVWADGFIDQQGEKSVGLQGRGMTAAATFAQAITCHKSQGSEWSKVLIVDESNVFRSIRLKSAKGDPAQVAKAHAEARSWLYTAVTRASDRSIIVPVEGVLPR